MPAEPDLTLRFAEEPITKDTFESSVEQLFTLPGSENQAPRVFAANFLEIYSLTGPSFRARLPRTGAVVISDWVSGNPHIVAGRLLEQTPADPKAAACRCTGVWAADVEMDGDLDIVAAPDAGVPFVLRNNGDGGWTSVSMFEGVNSRFRMGGSR
jgi:hypothetical protein